MCPDSEYDTDARFALGMAPLAQEIANRVREMLPEGTHFGVFILTPPHEGEGRVIAITSDREVMAPQIAQWFLSVFNRKGK